MKGIVFPMFVLITGSLLSQINQSCKVVGKVVNSSNNEPVVFAKITVINLNKGSVTSEDGSFEIDNIVPGVYSFKATASGFEDAIINEITVTIARTTILNFQMDQRVVNQQEVTILASPFVKKSESPLSLRTLNATEIERLPGANRDVSKVLQALPGVAARATFRNDIIIRGGSPGENKFYLDGIEVPNINHFATQGSSGGPVGLLNVNFIKEVEFYSGSFPSNRANGLSSVISFKQKDGNPDAFITNFALGSSDIALTFDGPVGKKCDFIFSVRRSYLQFLFAALKLPFLPTYNDSQFKFNIKLNEKNKISVIGLGAYDQFDLNLKVNDQVKDSSQRAYNDYILGYIPFQNQWNYTFGINYTHYSKNSFQTIVLSRNMLQNNASRYNNNITKDQLIFDYASFEAENKIRLEHTYSKNGWKLNMGIGYEYARYFNSTFNTIFVAGAPLKVDFSSNLFLSKYAVFSQLSKSLFSNRLNLSAGLRTDMSNYSSSLFNPLDQLSPMFASSLKLSNRISWNANIARYHQLPAYTILGYRNQNNQLANKINNVKYIECDQVATGFDYLTAFNSRFSVEGFYKKYNRYPFSVNDSISLANLGADFGVVGNEQVKSISKGRSYGVEFLYQQKLVKGFYGIVAYTIVRSEFLDKNSNYIPSAWDSKHIVSITGGKRFKNGWEFGFRWLFTSGAPYTPYDLTISSLKTYWDAYGQGKLNYNAINTARESNFHQLNIRVDKKIYLQKISMNFYLDIQNVYGYKTKVAPILLVEKDANGLPVTDPENPDRYKTKLINQTNGIVQPTIGVIVEFANKKKAK